MPHFAAIIDYASCRQLFIHFATLYYAIISPLLSMPLRRHYYGHYAFVFAIIITLIIELITLILMPLLFAIDAAY
jgi:hypothetical protein